MEQVCEATTVHPPTGRTVACNRHTPGWHYAYAAPWHTRWPDAEHRCSHWTSYDTAGGLVVIFCGQPEQHTGEHQARVGLDDIYWT